MSDLTYRGKCKELSELACKADSTLRLVRGHVYVLLWNTTEAHWWTVRPDGSIFDPSVLQFPTNPFAEDYKEFNGKLNCCECGKEGTEDTFKYLGARDYFACSNKCALSFVGL